MNYTSRTQYDINGLTALAKGQFKLYGKWTKIALRTAGCAFIIIGMLGGYTGATRMGLLLCGFLSFMSLMNTPKNMAKKMLKAYAGSLPKVEYEFADSEIRTMAGGRKGSVKYKEIADIAEYGEYLVLFLNKKSGLIVSKSKLNPANEEGFKKELTQKTGKQITQVNDFNFTFAGKNISM